MDSLSAAVNNMSIQGSPRSPLAAADDDVQVTPPPANEAERRAAQLVFFDLETTVPATDVIEFGAIVVDRHAFYEIETYQSLVFSDKIDDRSIAANGITPEMLEGAPQFEKIADRVYDIMHGRIWVGHNILAFDNVQLRAAFERIKKPAPEPAGLVDTLVLLRKQTDYVKRLGSLAMANLGAFYGLGEEKHRTIADCRMTIDVMKCIALNQFFEQHVPDLFPVKIVRQKKVKRRTDLWKKNSSAPAASASADDSKDGDPNTTPAARRSNRRAPKTPQVDVPSVPVPADGFDAAAAGGWGDDVPEDPALVALIDHALANQIPMYMCYGGSSNPLSVKRVLVQSWGDRPKTFRAFVEGSANDNAIYFATRRVVKLHEQPFTMQS